MKACVIAPQDEKGVFQVRWCNQKYQTSVLECAMQARILKIHRNLNSGVFGGMLKPDWIEWW
jgi:hypothetical protein